MEKLAWAVVGLTAVLIVGSVGLEIAERTVFPVWKPNYFDNPPGKLGPYNFTESRAMLEQKIEGEKYGFTAFMPEGLDEPLPLFIWVTGSNVKAYYQQSLHETLASWGYLVIVPDAPHFSFVDPGYHRIILKIASQAMSSVKKGSLDQEVDESRLAAGGYSVGSSLAAFLAAKKPEIDALVYWGPSGSPYWLGVNGRDLYSQVDQPALYVLGELDERAPPGGGFTKTMQELMPKSPAETFVIENGNHLYFQQPTDADRFGVKTELTRVEQQKKAINATRKWLNDTLN